VREPILLWTLTILDDDNRIGIVKDLEQVATLDLELGTHTKDLAIDEARNWVYVVNESNDSIVVIQDTKITAIVEAAGRYPQEVTVEPNSGWAYVVEPYRAGSPLGGEAVIEGHVTVLNGPEVVGTILLEDIAAWHVAADPVDGYVYVAGSQLTDDSPIGHPEKGVIVVFKGLDEVARLETLLPVDVMDANSETGEVYASDGGHQLYHFKQGKLLTVTEVVEGNDSIRNLRVHPETGDVYLVNWGEQTEVIVIRGRNEIARIPVRGSSLKMAIDPMSGNVYVADFWFNMVAVIHGTEIIATLETGLYPYGIAVNPANGWVYVSNTNEGTVTVLGFQD
jgi:DNA-binding beta-propeller fold protein YncE